MMNGEPDMKLASWRNQKDPTLVAKDIADLYEYAQVHTDIFPKRVLNQKCKVLLVKSFIEICNLQKINVHLT